MYGVQNPVRVCCTCKLQAEVVCRQKKTRAPARIGAWDQKNDQHEGAPLILKQNRSPHEGSSLQRCTHWATNCPHCWNFCFFFYKMQWQTQEIIFASFWSDVFCRRENQWIYSATLKGKCKYPWYDNIIHLCTFIPHLLFISIQTWNTSHITWVKHDNGNTAHKLRRGIVQRGHGL